MQKMISATPTNTKSSTTADVMFQEKCLVQLNNIALCISQMAESQEKTNALLQRVLSLNPDIDFLDDVKKEAEQQTLKEKDQIKVEIDSSYCVEDNDINRIQKTQNSEKKLSSSPAYTPAQTINSGLAMENRGQAQKNIDDPVVAAIASFSE